MHNIESPFMRSLEEQAREYRRVQRLEQALTFAVMLAAAGWVAFAGMIWINL